MAVRAKGGSTTAKLEAVIGSGANSLKKAVGEASKVLKAVEEATALAEVLTTDVTTKQAELDNLSAQFEQRERELLIDLDLRVQERKDDLIKDFLTAQGKEAILSSDLAQLKSDNLTLAAEFQSELAKQVAAVKQSEAASYHAAKNIAEANAKATNAQQAADLATALKQVTFFETQIRELHAQLNAERAARVSEAQARGNAMVNVTTGK